MCALFGWLDCGKKLPHKLLKKLTQALANAAEACGTLMQLESHTLRTVTSQSPENKD